MVATVITLPGWNYTPEEVAQLFKGSVTANRNLLTVQLPVPNPTASVTLPAVVPSAYLTALNPSVLALDFALTSTSGQKIVLACEFGALIASMWLQSKGPTSSIPAADLSFILVRNPARRNGGALFGAGYAVPLLTPYTVNDVSQQYDGWSDWPATGANQESDDISVLNALYTLDKKTPDYVNADLNDPAKLTLVQGNLTQTLLPTFPVPILLKNPVPDTGFVEGNPVLAQADKAIRPLVEAAYVARSIGPSSNPLYPPPVSIPPSAPPSSQPPGTAALSTAPCLNSDHFYVKDGGIRPQPWMQQRIVATATTETQSGSYDASSSSGSGNPADTLAGLFGSFFTQIGNSFDPSVLLSGIGGGLVSGVGSLLGVSGTLNNLFSGIGTANPLSLASANKNRLLQTVLVQWTNLTPLDQWVYGLITRGGSRVTLQARSRGYIVVSSGYNEGRTPGDLEIASVNGCGADIGLGGVLAIGTSYCIIEQRQNGVTIPLAPERTGWYRLAPGKTITAAVQTRFVTEFWENGQIDGGNLETNSSYDAGDLRVDLVATPVLG